MLSVLTTAVTLVCAGCGSSGSSPPTVTASAPREQVSIALDYSANVDYLGIYAAIDNGYFAAERIDVKIIPYANTPAEPLIQAGKADLAISYPPDVIINRAQGLRYRAVAALVAHNTTALAVLASSRFTRPADLTGRLYGGFGIESDPPIISAIFRADGVTKPSFRQVVLNTDVISALAHNRVQYTAVFGGIDDVTAELQGVKLRTFPYRVSLGAAGDYPNAVFVASDEEINRRADALRRALKALAEGYEFAAAHPAQAEQILIGENRTALANATLIVKRTGDATAPSFLDSAGHWGPMSDADFAGLTAILVAGGIIKGAAPAPADLYTNHLLPHAP